MREARSAVGIRMRFVSNVAMCAQMHVQVREVSNALGVNASNLGSRRSGAVVLDERSLRIFAGLPLKQILELPSTAIVKMSVVKAPQGKWVLPSLELVFSLQSRTMPLDLCLMNSFGFPMRSEASSSTGSLRWHGKAQATS
jgi:hypothetical protein